MNKKILEILACPVCKGKLIYHKPTKELICRMDKVAFSFNEGIPVMLADEARSLSLEEVEAIRKST